MRSSTPYAPSGADKGFFGHPRALGPLFFTEMWERFSFYGVRPMLVLFMAAPLLSGGLGFDAKTAAAIVGIYGGAVYLAALPGGWLADNWLGQRRAVWYGSILIALGHLSIASSALVGPVTFFVGLILIVMGTGLFKTCISVMVGSLYDEDDARRDGGFAIFYMGINLGSLVAPLLTGWLMETRGWHWGFATGGTGMLVALILFRLWAVPAMRRADAARERPSSWDAPAVKRRHVGKFVLAAVALVAAMVILVATGIVRINPRAVAEAMTSVLILCSLVFFVYLLFFSGLDGKERKRVAVCLILVVAGACFWAAFEQQPTSYNLFAAQYTDRSAFDREIPTLWFQSLNPIFIVLLGPLFGWLWPALGRRRLEPGSPVKFVLGLLLAAIGFGIMVLAARQVISSNGLVSPLWIVGSMLLLTLGELCLSPVGLSTMSGLSPQRTQGQLMGLWFTGAALGNLVAGLIGGHVNPEELQQMPELFARSAIALVIFAMILLLLAPVFKRMLRHNRIIDPRASAEGGAEATIRPGV
uniref:peptide MFS transporter n=1 Tax=Halomonas sp. TaxID=1486246 RepID=UPI002614374E|nr:peptide MFS transporter [Halomonas sp.]